jgi:hypothetical protein
MPPELLELLRDREPSMPFSIGRKDRLPGVRSELVPDEPADRLPQRLVLVGEGRDRAAIRPDRIRGQQTARLVRSLDRLERLEGHGPGGGSLPG